MKLKAEQFLSHLISSIGHPILLGSLAAIYVNFREFDGDKAWRLTLTLIIGYVLPIVVFLIYKMKKGDYENFDVSNQKKRNSLYIFSIFLLALFMGYLFLINSTWLIKCGIIPVFLLTLSSYFINKKIKVSLHTSFSFLLATMMIQVETSAAFTMYLFAILIGYSRLHLKRHSIPEVALGAILGVGIGFIFHFVYRFGLEELMIK
ncbi:phosphatase PAP2 family protein [uncultured Arcticibacterium sp.]|uniref:phosphatase PAP2 family protein n=1 Tax=uncultured Arcticibacterium sp. TaxID=2173042 RepID=UPI0030F949A3